MLTLIINKLYFFQWMVNGAIGELGETANKQDTKKDTGNVTTHHHLMEEQIARAKAQIDRVVQVDNVKHFLLQLIQFASLS